VQSGFAPTRSEGCTSTTSSRAAAQANQGGVATSVAASNPEGATASQAEAATANASQRHCVP